MTSHFLMLALFAACVSTAFAVLQRDTVRDQVRLGLWLFAGFLAGAYLLGWMMYPLPFGS